jgi:hypothetical protein
MAEQNAGQQLDKSTPDSTWKKLLSAQEVSDVCFCICPAGMQLQACQLRNRSTALACMGQLVPC